MSAFNKSAEEKGGKVEAKISMVRVELSNLLSGVQMNEKIS